MSAYLTFLERRDGGKRSQRKADELSVNVDRIDAVLARKTYTTLQVNGRYIHIAEEYQTVMDRINMCGEVDRAT